MPLPAIIAGGTALAGSIGSWIQGKRQAKKTREANREMAKFAYSKDLEQWQRQTALNQKLWEMQNQYNAPSQQMERLKKAGLNPRLIYGQSSGGASGTAGAVQTAEMSKYQAPRQEFTTQPLNTLSALGAYQDIRLKSAQINNIESRTRTESTRRAINITKNTNLRFDQVMKQFETEGLTPFKDEALEQVLQSPMYNKYQQSISRATSEAELRKIEAGFWKDLNSKSGLSGTGAGLLLKLILMLKR